MSLNMTYRLSRNYLSRRAPKESQRKHNFIGVFWVETTPTKSAAGYKTTTTGQVRRQQEHGGGSSLCAASAPPTPSAWFLLTGSLCGCCGVWCVLCVVCVV